MARTLTPLGALLQERIMSNPKLVKYVDRFGRPMKSKTGPDWQGDCYCNGVWAKECCNKSR